jgi:hypothetical protein
VITVLPAPCWLVTPTPDRDGTGPYHFLPEDEAKASVECARLNAESAEDGSGVTWTRSRAEELCTIVTCVCGEEPEDHDGEFSTLHFPDPETFRRQADDVYAWVIRDGEAYCSEDCAPPPVEPRHQVDGQAELTH